MNKTERKMTNILRGAKENFGVVSVKAEFEAEGTRIEELLRLVDVSRSAGLPLTVKIGGCEAIRDLLESKQIGVRYVVAPMVETAYAASKLVAAKNLVFTEDELLDTDFLLNLETETGFLNRQEILSTINVPGGAQGLVFGRVDFVGSLGLSREAINTQKITDYVLDVANLCSLADAQLVMGGGVSIESLDAIRQVHQVRLDRFETRKVVFDADQALRSDIELGLLEAVRFELMWLQNKQEYYGRISLEDEKRISMLIPREKELSDKYSAR
jgi:citrate lyase beta subunit